MFDFTDNVRIMACIKERSYVRFETRLMAGLNLVQCFILAYFIKKIKFSNVSPQISSSNNRSVVFVSVLPQMSNPQISGFPKIKKLDKIHMKV